jgi:hypothetical protein
MVYKDAEEAAVRWELKPKFYSRTEDRILTIIQQAELYVTTKGHTLSNKVGYLEEAIKSIKHSIEFPESY